MRIVVLTVISAVAVMILASSGNVSADLLQGSTKQRIGNYDVEITTDPKSPTANTNPTKILIRITGVNGDHPTGVPIMMRLMKDGNALQTTNPIIVQSGHHSQEFTFTDHGRYILYIDLNDYLYSGEVLTFTFFINVSSPFDYLYLGVASALVLAGTISILIFIKSKKFKSPARQS